MSSPTKVPRRWPIYAGDAATAGFTFTVPGSSTPATLTADGWACMWRATRDAATAISATVDTSEAVSDAKITVTFTGAQTRTMGGPGFFDLQQTVGSDDPVTYVHGETSWTEDVTRT